MKPTLLRNLRHADFEFQTSQSLPLSRVLSGRHSSILAPFLISFFICRINTLLHLVSFLPSFSLSVFVSHLFIQLSLRHLSSSLPGRPQSIRSALASPPLQLLLLQVFWFGTLSAGLLLRPFYVIVIACSSSYSYLCEGPRRDHSSDIQLAYSFSAPSHQLHRLNLHCFQHPGSSSHHRKYQKPCYHSSLSHEHQKPSPTLPVLFVD
ncbi:hypothetical protein ACRALDRAFT_209065 [Sodiomyces alcalophilus JCM 7366]|uniref:uncharacterized protein n=1 Tax=Sodiomyces alcalophilus JCM 7366 TaxID=591952 RepID=UPI0039B4D982